MARPLPPTTPRPPLNGLTMSGGTFFAASLTTRAFSWQTKATKEQGGSKLMERTLQQFSSDN